MRKRYTLISKVILLLLLAVEGVTMAQTHEFAPVGAEWYYSYANIFTIGYIHIEAVKDTVIDGMECVKLEKREYGYSMDPWGIGPGLYEGRIINEYVASSENKVYLYRDQTFNLWFNFDAEVGDSWPVPPPYNVGDMISDTAGFLIVQAKGTKVINGKELKYIDVIDREGSEWGYGNYLYGQSPYTVRIYERIGPVGCYMFPETHWWADANEGGPFRCYEDEEFGHVSDFPYNCDYINPEYQAILEREKDSMEVFPNPATGRVKIENKEIAEIQVYNSFGLLVKTFQDTDEIHLETLPKGIYMLLITDTKNAKYETKVILK